MVKEYSNEVVYDFSPVHTLNYLHRKYPNPFATHVYTVDTLSRTIDPQTGLIRSERLIGVQQGAPGWIKKLFSLPETAYVREVVFIDPGEPRATCMSMNLSLKQYVSCLEFITYSPYHDPKAKSRSKSTAGDSASSGATSTHGEEGKLEPGVPGPGALLPYTLFSQRATFISEFSTAMIARRIEAASVDRFGKNAGVGKKGFEWVLTGGQDKR